MLRKVAAENKRRMKLFKRTMHGKHFAELSLELLQTEMDIYDLT